VLETGDKNPLYGGRGGPGLTSSRYFTSKGSTCQEGVWGGDHKMTEGKSWGEEAYSHQRKSRGPKASSQKYNSEIN